MCLFEATVRARGALAQQRIHRGHVLNPLEGYRQAGSYPSVLAIIEG